MQFDSATSAKCEEITKEAEEYIQHYEEYREGGIARPTETIWCSNIDSR